MQEMGRWDEGVWKVGLTGCHCHRVKFPCQISFLSESAYRYALSLKKEIMSRSLDFLYVSMEKILGAYVL